LIRARRPVTTVLAIHEADTSKLTVLLAETAERAKMLNEAFFAVDSELVAKAASAEENALADENLQELMELEMGMGEKSFGNMLLDWQEWNRTG
jgi:hypothetical protein